MGYRIEILVEECMSSGKCVADYPGTFEFDDDELAAFVAGAEPMSDDAIVRVARNCPSRALAVFDEDGKKIET